MGSEEPVALPVGFVEALQARAPSAPMVAAVIETFAANSVVRILGGAFAGRLGRVLQSTQKSTRLKVQAFAGRDTVLIVPTIDLAAGRPPPSGE